MCRLRLRVDNSPALVRSLTFVGSFDKAMHKYWPSWCLDTYLSTKIYEDILVAVEFEVTFFVFEGRDLLEDEHVV